MSVEVPAAVERLLTADVAREIAEAFGDQRCWTGSGSGSGNGAPPAAGASWLNDGHTRARVTRTGTETVYLVITLTARRAPPEHVAVYIRNHWSIENRVHPVRDVTLREDSSQVRTGSRPRILVSLRNLSTGLIRQSGHDKIAATLRDAGHDNDLLLAIARL